MPSASADLLERVARSQRIAPARDSARGLSPTATRDCAAISWILVTRLIGRCLPSRRRRATIAIRSATIAFVVHVRPSPRVRRTMGRGSARARLRAGVGDEVQPDSPRGDIDRDVDLALGTAEAFCDDLKWWMSDSSTCAAPRAAASDLRSVGDPRLPPADRARRKALVEMRCRLRHLGHVSRVNRS